jgi:hypothetical protein
MFEPEVCLVTSALLKLGRRHDQEPRDRTSSLRFCGSRPGPALRAVRYAFSALMDTVSRETDPVSPGGQGWTGPTTVSYAQP